jgi:putative MATE family efflux protein
MPEEEKSVNLPKEKEKPKRDLTKGSIATNLWTLSWPMTISTMVMMIGPVIDMIWIGKLGGDAIAGVGVSVTVVMLINSLIMGVFTGLRAMVARFVGAGDMMLANRVAQQAFVLAVAMSLLVAVIGLFLAESILQLLGVDAAVVAEGATYMRINLVGIITMALSMVAQNMMQASGDSKTPMKISIATRIFHIVLCPFMIFGWWIFPQLGVTGAALTDVIAQAIAGSLGLWVVFSGRTNIRPTLKNFKFDGNILWRIIKIGIPSSLGGIHMNLGSVIFMWFIAPFGTLAVAGHTLVGRLDSFVIMPALGLGTAAGILAAQNIGAGKPERASRTAWIAIGWFTGLMAFFSIALFIWAQPVLRIFNSDPELVGMAANFLKIQLVSYMMNGLMIVMMSVMNSMGDTVTAMYIDIVTMWGIRVPLAVILPRITNLGVYGVRWALVADTLSSAIVFIIYFRTGRWKKKKV